MPLQLPGEEMSFDDFPLTPYPAGMSQRVAINLLLAVVLLWTGTLLHDLFEDSFSRGNGEGQFAHYIDGFPNSPAVVQASGGTDDGHYHGPITLSTSAIKFAAGHAPAVLALVCCDLSSLSQREMHFPRERAPPYGLVNAEKLSRHQYLRILLI